MRLHPNHAYRVDGQADAITYRLARDLASDAVDTLGREQCFAAPRSAAAMAVEVAREFGEVRFFNRRERLAFEDTVRRFILNQVA